MTYNVKMGRENRPAVMAGKILLLVIIVALVSGIWFTQSQQRKVKTSYLVLGTATVEVQILDTEALRAQGLSGVESLPATTGRLFIFPQDGEWGIWMKEMSFPIDIIWIDSLGEVVTIKEGATPESYPEVFFPAAPVRYVVEVNAGKTAEWGLTAGAVVPEIAEKRLFVE